MIDPKSLLDQFLGGDAGGSLRRAGGAAKEQFDRAGGLGGFAGGAAAGGLLGLLIGNKGMRKFAGARPDTVGRPFSGRSLTAPIRIGARARTPRRRRRRPRPTRRPPMRHRSPRRRPPGTASPSRCLWWRR